MNFKDLDIKHSYISCGDENISSAFLNPALKCTKIYKRSVGFFSSSVFQPIFDGIISLYRNHGKIKLIASPQLSVEDIEAINLGYENREKIITDSVSKDFIATIEKLDDTYLQVLATLISENIMDIKIAITNTMGMYHDKLGILEDFNGNTIAFYGSPNSSLNGYVNNYEKIRLSVSWKADELEAINDEQHEFDSLWDGNNPHVKIYDYKKCAEENILKVVHERKASSGNQSSDPVTLRDYQLEAISKWVENGYKGFYVMATGTGKTWTAIYSAVELLKQHSAMIVICAPYKHLIKQWAEDVEKVFSESSPILVSSENPNWEKEITDKIIGNRYGAKKQIIIISTIASFKMDRFKTTLMKSNEDKLLIVDEAHRFTLLTEEIKMKFKYMLGLSATPYSGSSAAKGKELMKFFGGQVFNLPIEEALDKGFLVPYNYYPIFVNASEEEENRFQAYTQKIITCFNKAGRLINPDLLIKSVRGRLRVISMSSEKIRRMEEIICRVPDNDHFVVYCGDGRLFDNDSGEELRHIQSVKRMLTKLEYKSSQFTATENMTERMELVDLFNKGVISALAAIRCLDEGINIPSIKSALILSSNDDYREFVQRRGRILRKYPGKEYANIYDVIVLPSYDLTAWAKIEFRRFLEYARLASNWGDLENTLQSYLDDYGITIDEVNVYDYDEMEDELDE